MSRPAAILKTTAKWLLITLAVILLLVVLLVSAILLALRSDAGTAWVLEQIPGLETTNAEGSLLGQWQADGLTWQGYGMQLAVASPSIRWTPTCLLQARFCLDRLEAASIDMSLTPSGEGEEESKGAIALPEVNLPLNLDIRSVDLGTFHYNDTLVWDRLTLAAEGGGSDFQVHQATMSRQDVAVTLDGRIETRGDWPLAVNVDLTLPPPSGDAWQVDGQLRGSVRDLRAQIASSGYLEAEMEAEARPLDPSLPVTLDFRSEPFLAVDTLPQTLTLKDWTLTGRGNLNSGYRIQSQAQLPGQQGAIAMTVSGLVSEQGASDLTLQLTGPSVEAEGQAELTVEGVVDWQEALAAEAEVRMGAFPWFSLLPGVAPLPVTIRSLDASGRFAGDAYQASLEVDATGPMGEASLQTQVDGDLESVKLTDLRMTTGAGQLQGEAQVGFADRLSWQAELALDAFDPSYWVPQAKASISGSVRSEGQLAPNGEPDFTANWELQGQWQEAPLTSRGELEAVSGQWQIPEILATVGDNRLLASGSLQDPLGDSGTLSLEGTLELPDPGTVVPGLAGEMSANITLNGPIRLPYGGLEVAASGVSWQDQVSVEQLSLDARLDESHALDASLEVSTLQAGEQTVEQVQADLQGTLDDHRLTLSARHPSAEVDAALAGAWQPEGGQWQGQLASGEVSVPQQNQTWQLEEAAPISFTGETLTVGAHCWRWQDSTLCAGEQTLLPETALDLKLQQFPTSALAPLLPEGLAWNATINGDLNVTLAEDGPRGEVNVSAGPGEVVVTLEDRQQTLDYRTLDLGLDLEPGEARASVRLDGEDIGTLTMYLAVDPNAPELPTSGTYSLEGFDLAFVGALLQIENLEGQVAGSGRLEGPLLEPDVYGQITLSGGRLEDERSPIPIQDLTLQVTFNGSRANLDGSWRSNGTGTGEIGGSLEWSGEPQVTITLKGDRLPLHYEPYADLALSPDLKIRYGGGGLSVTGRIAIPSGRIEIRELPESAVAVSGDEVIVGAEAEPETGLSLNMDVTVVVGEDKVTFEGFGVYGELEGELRIGNDMDTRGALQLVNGGYEAFGQELELRRARLQFLGPVSEPYLDIEAIREVDEVLVGLRLSGPAREPETELFSEPAMSQNETLSYLILGRPLESQGDQNQVSRMALALGLNRASGITRGIGEAFGIKDLTLEAEGSGEESAVVASGYLTDDLSIRYGVGLLEPVTTVALRYDLGKYFYIEAASGLASSLDIFYNRDF